MDSANSDIFQISDGSRGQYLSHSSNGWFTQSDIRIKRDINPITTALSDILKLNPVYYNYKNDSPDAKPNCGFIAQELQKHFPLCVLSVTYSEELKDNILGINSTELIPYLVKSIQEQQMQIESLKNDISDIKSKLQNLT
jgi:hypothetical protein